ncbi:tryptophan synthase subunit alpha [Paenibacillus beijingensis]|uniref:tryptophan synthase n=1 Tax=Paenibacillus beijingensis TaxID=1126833 RepID=A0A0D5NFY8_9BACL|nr:tryptophan synthase subunit alpha [Paenibacillus beijingensis]AJY74156.1 hypothetical protein VN24_05655 [Paenibacillus beijingensis]
MRKGFYSRRNYEISQQAEEKGEGLLIGYLIAGDPSFDQSMELVKGAVAAGIDIVELGIPSRYPYLDGDIIKRGHKRAIQNSQFDSDNGLMEYARQLRADIDNPIWAMGYKDELVDSGLGVRLAEEGVIDGLVLPDCSLREQNDVHEKVCRYGVDVVRFINPQMTDSELAAAGELATILYAQSYIGATGNPFAQLEDLSELCRQARQHSSALVIAGFGLRSPARVRMAIDSGFDGAVVGSAFVARCENGEQDYLYRMIADMKLQTSRCVKKE